MLIQILMVKYNIMKVIQHFTQKTWLYLVILMIGVSLKFYRIDSHYFWYDEICTIMHTSGITEQQYMEMLPENNIKNISFYTDLVHLNKRDLTIHAQLEGLSKMTNLNPLHYALLVFWHRIAGDHDVDYRLFNVFIFFLTLPFLFVFSKLLFKSSLAGWIAIILFSVSPYFQYFTQEARYNLLCTFLIVVNQYLFLKSIDINKPKWWILYTLTGILALYSSFNLGLLFIGHFIYLLIVERKVLIPFIISSSLILLGYLPWLLSIIDAKSEIITAFAWHKDFGLNQNIFTLILAQVYFMAFSFVTFNDHSCQFNMFINHQFHGNYIQLFFGLLVMALLIYSIVYAVKKAEKKVLWLMAFIILPQFLYFLISDLVRGTGVSLFHRYHILNIIGIILFLVYLLKDKIESGNKTFAGIYVGILVIGILSILVMPNTKFVNLFQGYVEDASILSGYKNPLLISDLKKVHYDYNAGGILAFFNECKSDQIDVLRVKSDIKNIAGYFNAGNYSDIVVLGASDELVANLQTQFGRQMVPFGNKSSPRWKIDLKQK